LVVFMEAVLDTVLARLSLDTFASHGSSPSELIDTNFAQRGNADWNHINSVDYNAQFDQILLSRYVRGNADYGVNDFVDNGDGTVADDATGLMWSQTDSGAVGGDIRLMWRLEVGDVKCETWG